jgi:Leucine-rich repeat (LRR) protein
MKRIIVFTILFVFGYLNGKTQENTGFYCDINAALINPSLVKGLDLSNSKLETLPAAVVKFSNLEYLNLSGNQLKIIPSYVSELKNLKVLDISKMPYLNLQDALEKLVNLKFLQRLQIQETGHLFEKEESTSQVILVSFEMNNTL